MRFHLIDRIDAYEPGRSVRGRKLTSYSEDIWERRVGDLVMPSALVLEALCQAGTWLIMLSTERRQRAALLQVERVTFSGYARPGDELVLEGRVESLRGDMAVLSGSALVNGQMIMTAQGIMCALMDADDLEDAADSERILKGLTRA